MFNLNPEQQFVVNQAMYWYYHGEEQVFEFSGVAGAGKSVVLNEIIRRLHLDPRTDVAPMSFIGSASLVMRMKGLTSAKTAHSWIFKVHPMPLTDKNGKVVKDKLLNCPIMVPRFYPVDHLDENIKLIVIDEAYCMPKSLRPNIEKFGLKILACGDQNQLPPVNDEPAFLNGPCYRLTQCMRQLGKDDISAIANIVSNGGSPMNGYYGNSLVINKNQLTDDMLNWADVVICGTNKTRDAVNKYIRQIRGYNTDLPQYGEKVVCRNNNWLEGVKTQDGYVINLCNGLIGTVLNYPDVSSFDGELFSMMFMPNLAPEAIFNTRVNYNHMIADHPVRMKIRQNKYETGNKFEYAYCITSHIAQGGQFHNVVYIEEPMHPDIRNQVNFVGATRADNFLIYVKS